MLSNFLDEVLGRHDGYIYVPTRLPGSKRWNQNFFEWPQQSTEVLEFIESKSPTHEVFLSPCFFTGPRISPKTFKGTQWVWAELDLDEPPTDIPIQPTIQVQTSSEGHQHWYWKLDEFHDSVKDIQRATRSLAYALGADLSGWDFAQVLRPPGTYNHKRQKPVTLLHSNGSVYGLSSFNFLPEPPVAEVHFPVTETSQLPPLQPILAKYHWKDETYELFSKTVKYPGRSSALVRLAFDCVEMGMSNTEVITVLEDADRRWKKFLGRTDRLRRLVGILEHVYAKTEISAVASGESGTSSVFRFQDFLDTEVKLEWVIQDILPVAGSGIIFGPAGVGKSTWSLRMGMSIALGEDTFLRWTIIEQQKVLFISLEMPPDELKHFFLDMKLQGEVKDKLQEEFFVWPLGHAFPLDVPDYQNELLQHVDAHGIQLVIIDSMAVAMYGSVSSDDDIKRLNSFLNEDLRSKRKCGYWFVHHPHKPNENRRGTFYEMFGSIYIANNAQTIINVSNGKGNRVNLSLEKHRLTMKDERFAMIRNPDRSFSLAGSKPTKNDEIKEVESMKGKLIGLGKNVTRDDSNPLQ